MNQPTPEDIAAMRADGDLKSYLLALTGRTPANPKPALAAVPDPGYRITHTGGWPLGTAATGPTPPPDRCTCAKCGGNPAIHPQSITPAA
ncbi:hypothetical protein [Streptomyces europaeiscabiei]|uniref:hypothetical protein n=1 Tax=Streptomyces europaeiscabiei TaxID=146819 RepID=UPI0029A12724|nr:hypothetical protein [Streptomyces europaeiscabiei]MDX2528004.1 hypothetical protein [Streptomyces europaeiscabiei]MDX3549563.1 hypothetical protein [Streptomyces europaeiscabiei]